MSKIFVFALMVFMHILDDYFLQGMSLGKLKQKKFWEDNAPDKMYRFDYIAALLMHSYSWAFMILLPIAIYRRFDVGVLYAILLIVNGAVHFVVDDAKANRHKLNLLQDQEIHLLQIAASFIVMML